MFRPREIVRPATLLILLAIACGKPGCAPGPLSITPGSASPGQIVTLDQNRAQFLELDSLRVRIGGKPATIVSRDSNTRIKVMVPLIEPATSVRVLVFDGLKERGEGTLNVGATDCELLVFSVVRKRVRLLSIERCAGRPDSPRRSLDARLAIELVDRGGAVLHRTSVPHPWLTPGEAFGSLRKGPSAVARVQGPDSTWITVRVPVLERASRVRLYEIPPGHTNTGDPPVPKADTSRTFIGSFPLKGQ